MCHMNDIECVWLHVGPINLILANLPFAVYAVFIQMCACAIGILSVLVTRANDWLRKNGNLRVKTCESIEVKGRYDGVVDTNKSCYFEADHSKRRMRNLYIRALR